MVIGNWSNRLVPRLRGPSCYSCPSKVKYARLVPGQHIIFRSHPFFSCASKIVHIDALGLPSPQRPVVRLGQHGRLVAWLHYYDMIGFGEVQPVPIAEKVPTSIPGRYAALVPTKVSRKVHESFHVTDNIYLSNSIVAGPPESFLRSLMSPSASKHLSHFVLEPLGLLGPVPLSHVDICNLCSIAISGGVSLPTIPLCIHGGCD